VRRREIHASRARVRAIITTESLALGPEHLLSVYLVVGDCLLVVARNEPVNELMAKLLLHMSLNEIHVPRSDIT
jgi:hypothetical protein